MPVEKVRATRRSAGRRQCAARPRPASDQRAAAMNSNIASRWLNALSASGTSAIAPP
jgi:hypothetical protein